MMQDPRLASASLNAGAGQAIRSITPSLEQRLDHLQRGVERVQKLRSMIDSIVDRIATEPATPSNGHASPPPADLSSRFGDAIGVLHTNLDDIERLVHRLEASLFDQSPKPARG